LKVLVNHNIELEEASFLELVKKIRLCVRKVQSKLSLTKKLNGFEISFLVTDNEEIQSLNSEYRSINKPTNVLSFPFLEFDEGEIDSSEIESIHVSEKMLGDIIISYEKIISEAKEQNINLSDHFLHIVIHSILHILGFDHIDDIDAEKMENIEIEILSQMGIKNPYL